MSGLNVLVTGGAGYIGSHACKALAVAGHRPIAFDSLVHGHREVVKWGPLVVGDVTDAAPLREAIDAHAIDAVMHFAAFIAVGESVADPGRYYRNNVGGTLVLLEAMRDAGVDKLIFSSTAAVYGTPSTGFLTEAMPLDPINPYGLSKLASERMIADFGRAHGLKWAALRYFNAAGADPDGETGEDHDPETHLIPLALQAAAGQGALTLFGDDYPTPDGTCIRDYIHVADLAAAHVMALDALAGGAEPMALNLGTGDGVSNRQLVDAVERVTGRIVPHSIGPRRPGDPPVLVAEASRARRVLGWKPRMSEIDTIIATAWAWHQRVAESELAAK